MPNITARAAAFFEEITLVGVELRVLDGSRFDYRDKHHGYKGDDLWERIQEHKAGLMELLHLKRGTWAEIDGWEFSIHLTPSQLRPGKQDRWVHGRELGKDEDTAVWYGGQGIRWVEKKEKANRQEKERGSER